MKNIEFNLCFFSVILNLDKIKSVLVYTLQVLQKYTEHEHLTQNINKIKIQQT